MRTPNTQQTAKWTTTVTLCSPADGFTTPAQQVKPQGLLTQGSPFAPRGQGQAVSPWTDRHETYSSDDEGVSFAQRLT